MGQRPAPDRALEKEPYPDIDPWNLPDHVELRLAYHLMARKNPLDRKILYRLLGTPVRYSELRPLLGGKHDNNLTVALERLQQNGLVAQTLNAAPGREGSYEYQITDLGILVVLTMERIRPIHHVVEEYLAARPLPHSPASTD